MSEKSFTTFFLNDLLFGIDIRYVREINKHLDLSIVPHAPEYIRGLINLRGQIVTVMDLKDRLSLGTCNIGSETHNLIIKTDTEMVELRHTGDIEDELVIPDKIGLLVDGIGDVITVPIEEIDPPPANASQLDRKFLAGVVKLDRSLLTILSMKEVMGGCAA